MAFAGAAHAQTASEAVCARANLTPYLQVACASPRLRALIDRNAGPMRELIRKLDRADQGELIAGLQARQAEHAAYCRIGNQPQLPPSAATENCVAGWADWTYAETQRGLQFSHNGKSARRSGVSSARPATPPEPMPTTARARPRRPSSHRLRSDRKAARRSRTAPGGRCLASEPDAPRFHEPAMSATSNAARQRRFRERATANGWVQCNVWVPAAAVPDLQLHAELLRQHAQLTVWPLRDPHSGRFVALRERKATLRLVG
jgi:hypothetical protein